ncbi:MAG TPA: hypothetical protein VGN38_12655 [Caulobacteraceae bacterium]|nr:hypothetical protein [Caulobacteraceae bacterium]
MRSLLLLLALAACSPTPVHQVTTAPKVAPSPPPPPPPPAKKATMICRNSQTGAKAECGTPNAVMVGIKTE